jgi:hypothetical protein
MKIKSLGLWTDEYSDQRLAEMWCELNRWGWPAELPRPELRSLEEHGNERRSNLMGDIVHKIGFRACLREWNRETLSDAEFDAWWRVNKRHAA